MSKPALRSLGAVLDFENSVLQLKKIGTDVKLKEGPTGHYLLDLFHFPVLFVSENTENDAPEIFPDGLVKDSDTIDDSGNALVATDTEAIQEFPIRRPLSTTPTLRCWTRIDDNCLTLRATRLDGPPWSSVRERETFDADTGETVETRRSVMDLTRRQRRAQIDRLRRLETRLYYDPSAVADEKTRQSLQESELGSRDTRENCVVMSRRLKCRIKRQCSEALFSGRAKRTTIAELFSPPDMVLDAARRGGVSRGSYDLTTGYDMQVPSVRQKVRTQLERDRPDVLVASPPYSGMGIWNRDSWSRVDDWRREFVLLWSFTCLCMQDQLARGGIVFLEHPWTSWTWGLPSTKQLFKSCMRVRGDTRVLGRMDERPMKETTGWLTNSDELARALMQLRPGKHGDELMDDVLSAVGLERNQEVSEPGNEAESESISEDGSDDDDTEKKVKRRRVIKRPVEQVLRESGRPQMESALRRLHVNLGHCSTNELVRILKHSGATEAAITLARQFSCDVCRENTRPTSARPASPTEVTIFNERLGVDQFGIPGLRHLEKRKMLNIVDHGSGFQMVIPLKSDDSMGIRQAYVAGWKRWARAPKQIVFDAAKQNFGKDLADPLELEGTEFPPIAGEGQWQNGTTEIFGGIWRRIFVKMLQEVQPKNDLEWAECVDATNEAKSATYKRHGYSSYHHVFGRDPHVASDLLQGPIDVIAATQPLYDSGAERSTAIRMAARKAALELQDSDDLRRALAARPRPAKQFTVVDKVAYWRRGKGQGFKQGGARWHGRATVVGFQGDNLIVSHRNNFLRCAPEQVRHATLAEVTGDTLVENVLRGAQAVLQQSGQQGMVDLTQAERPPTSESVHDVLKQIP